MAEPGERPQGLRRMALSESASRSFSPEPVEGERRRSNSLVGLFVTLGERLYLCRLHRGSAASIAGASFGLWLQDYFGVADHPLHPFRILPRPILRTGEGTPAQRLDQSQETGAGKPAAR